ncbi:MAG: molybdopterin dinucleotide binding domain-containing protein, partial [Myxococcota bacterium]
EPEPSTELVLIGRRHLRSNNSWLHNSHRLVKGPNRCTAMMNPSDAAERGLSSGQLVAVTSRVGEIHIPVEITDEVGPGTVSIPHGWGHDREGVRLSVARAHPGASLNDLTDPSRLDPLSGNAAFSGTPVEVRAL